MSSDYVEYFADCGVQVECVNRLISFKHNINYYRLVNRKDWQKVERAKKKICRYFNAAEFDGEPRSGSDFAIAFQRPEKEWLFYKYEDYSGRLCNADIMPPGTFTVGKTLDGNWVDLNIQDTRSILIAGSSGGGKSSLMNCIIDGLIRTTTRPEQDENNMLMMDFIDLKKVELSYYEPLAVTQHRVATTQSEALSLLQAVKRTIEERYTDMSNRNIIKATVDDYPIYVIFVDEYSTLNASEGTDINELVRYITSVGRACNVYMVIATQHPKNSVIDNSIRANCATKFVLACANTAQSNTICGQRIGVDLLGKGDAYICVDGRLKPIRVQTPLYDDVTRSASLEFI